MAPGIQWGLETPEWLEINVVDIVASTAHKGTQNDLNS